jgi:Glycosyltransferase
MKILMAHKFLYAGGGADIYMLAIGRYLAEHGHEVQYFGMADEKNIVGNAAGSYTENIDFHKKSSRSLFYPFKIIYSREARTKIRAVLEKFNPDIVHIHNINFQITPSILYEIKKLGIPIVQTVHDAQMACPCHNLYAEKLKKPCTACVDSGRYINCIRYRCSFGSLPKSIVAAMESYYYHFRKTYDLIDRFICVSEFMQDILIRNGMDVGKLLVLPVASRFAKAEAVSPVADNKYVLYFGRMVEVKGVRTLLQVCRALPDFHFKMIGTGPLETEVKRLPNVEWMGFKDNDELKSIISQAAFTVCPSEWYENSPATIVESQAQGVPVIGARIGGIPEKIEEGKTGLLFESGNIADLKEKIQKLYQNDSLLFEMRANCLNAKRVVCLPEYCDMVVSVYHEVMAESK